MISITVSAFLFQEIERRRAALRLKVRAHRDVEEETELIADKPVDAEQIAESSEEESEYEEYTDSEEDEDGPMLKPVGVCVMKL